MSSCKIRPHHSLCLSFFVGKGYSSEFTENMSRVKEWLEKEAPTVEITMGADMICEHCPHKIKGECEASEKVERYDSTVCRICGFSDGEALPWKEISEAAQNKIIKAGRLREVCGDCQWIEICREVLNSNPNK